MTESPPDFTDAPEQVWGYWIDDVFVVLPKIPLQQAGMKTPPFDVTRPDGRVLHVVVMS